ncbi:MAG: hypothetical protein JNM90_23280 [Burkholderiales bacterium]|nr:hypothetical protein [Burkholderiales bacterium]
MTADDKASASARLAEHLARASRARRAAYATAASKAAHLALKAWQAERLARTHADLLANPRYREAAQFFLTDLYGARDYSQRDADVARVAGKLTAMLPAAAVATIADALELDALSEELDGAMVAALGGSAVIDEAGYARAYRLCGKRDARARQIRLMREIGDALDHLTRLPLLEGTLRLMRGPARLAGLQELQGFLERGFGAFKRMRGAGEFLTILETRETQLMARWFEAPQADAASASDKA